ncbi:MAG: response regulator [Burkholderiaceae bacterium]|nr:response regulator [Burkholderiaceae bacterium]
MSAVSSGTKPISQVDAALDATQEFLASCIDSLSSHIAVLDEDGVILAVNGAWRRFADQNGYGGGNYGVGSNYVDACQPTSGEADDCIFAVAGLRDVLHGRRNEFQMEYPCHSAGARRWFILHVTRFTASGPARLVVAHEEITQRKHAEEALKEADRRKDEFLAILAHELRNPLAPIRHALKIIRVTDGDPEVLHSACEIMERQIGHMVRLVDDLLDVNRISRGTIELRRQSVDLASAIKHAVEAATPSIVNMQQTLTVMQPPQPIYLNGDLTRLAQALSNLLSNASRYTERAGSIYLTIAREGGQAVIKIKDTGIGIAAEQLPLVFDMFNRLDSPGEHSQSGLGIGLTVVKNLIEMHGGTVVAYSAGLGQGCEFVVRLPVEMESEHAPTEPATAPEAKPMLPRRILVVDDNRDSATSLATFLKLFGNETYTAFDGREAVGVAAAIEPDVVLLDIGMPKMNGYDAARRIRAQSWGHRVILVAVTGWGQEEDRRKAHEAGFNCHMVKPVDPAHLMSLLSSLSPQHQVEYEVH